MSRKVFLSADGGGSKLRMLLFDEDFQVLGEGLCGGVNMYSTTGADARANVRQCLEQVFSRGVPAVIDKLYSVFVSPDDFLLEVVEEIFQVREFVLMTEPVAGLLAGALWRSGLLALAGTGSDVFYIPAGSPLKHRKGDLIDRHLMVGGWGPILGDQGSGAWMGQQAVQRALAALEGWGEPTLMLELIRREWQMEQDLDLLDMVYRSPAPFRKLGSLTRVVAQAADAGDKVARDILTEAGRLMARQTRCLTQRHRIPAEDDRLVTCGGAWKTHPLMFETFERELAEVCPGLPVRRHRFEHVMAGPAWEMLLQELANAEEQLARLFPKYVIHWN